MHAAEKLSLEQIRGFIAASEELRFESDNRVQRYAWVERVLIDGIEQGVIAVLQIAVVSVMLFLYLHWLTWLALAALCVGQVTVIYWLDR